MKNIIDKRIKDIKKLKETFPCENCITFPMCKNRHTYNISETDKVLNVSYITGRCPLLKKWYQQFPSKDTPLSLISKINEILIKKYGVCTISF
jgi:hypothetical protein